MALEYCDTELVSWASNILDRVDVDDTIYAASALAFDIEDSKEKLALDLHTEADTAYFLETRMHHSFHLRAEVENIEDLELFFAP